MAKDKSPPSKQFLNEETLGIYASLLCGAIAVVVGIRYLHAIFSRVDGEKDAKSVPSIALRVIRNIDRPSPWTWPGRPSIGLILLTGCFIVANGVLMTNNLALRVINHYASRSGWVGAANMALCVFLALKNTPLALVTTTSHAEINILHRISGYVAFIQILNHAILYTVHFGRQGKWAKLIERENIEGIGAGFAIVLLALGILRHRSYEVFYVSHIVAFISVVVLSALHRPDLKKRLPVVMVLMGGVWALDCMIRLCRTLFNLSNNHVTVHPLPGGATRLVLRKPTSKSVLPAEHCYLWIPQIRLFQRHPFTIVNNDDSGMELVVRSYDGLTREIQEYAVQHPGSSIRASTDGPYGSLPDMTVYDRLVLVSGGSGAAFTFGVVNRILAHPELMKFQSIDFIWTVRRKEHLQWFRRHLENLNNADFVVITLYLTGEEQGSYKGHKVTEIDADQADAKDIPALNGALETGEIRPLLKNTPFPDKFALQHGRMDAGAVFGAIMETAHAQDRILLATCGPEALMGSVKDAVWTYISGNKSSRIDIHCEEFGE